MQLPSHGANPKHLTKLLQLPLQENAIDFSVNTTPFPLQRHVVDNWNNYLEVITKYPDPTSEKLKMVIAEKEQLSTNELLVGNGVAQLIFLIATYFQKKRVAIVEPTFSEYRDACRTFGCDIETIVLNEPWLLDVDKILQGCLKSQLLFICNPNNPTGVAYPLKQLEDVIKNLALVDITVVIDEAFFDFQEEGKTLIQLIKRYPNLIVLRSLTKMYGIAGLRLGYMAANPIVIKNISKLQNPWSVNGIAQLLGCDCLEDAQYVRNVQEFVTLERKRVFYRLQQLGYETSNSQVNFYILREVEKQEDCIILMKYLIENDLIPRHTYNFPALEGRYLRLAIKTVEENNQLLTVLQRWKQRC
jgi:threonine-phosphate decarboxylase